MEISDHDLLREVSNLTQLQDVRVTVTESIKGSMIIGASALVCSLLFGTIGLAIGGIIGGVTATYVAEDFESIPYIIEHRLTQQQRSDLAAAIFRRLGPIAIRSAADFLQITRDASTAAVIASTVISFIILNEAWKSKIKRKRNFINKLC